MNENRLFESVLSEARHPHEWIYDKLARVDVNVLADIAYDLLIEDEDRRDDLNDLDGDDLFNIVVDEGIERGWTEGDVDEIIETYGGNLYESKRRKTRRISENDDRLTKEEADSMALQLIKENIFQLARDATLRPRVGTKQALDMIAVAFINGYSACKSGMHENLMRGYADMVRRGAVE